MSAPDAIHWPGVLSALEAKHIVAAAEDDPAAAIAAPDMTAQYSDDIDFVSQQVRIAEERNIAIEADMCNAQEAGDDDAYDAAAEAFAGAHDDLRTLESRLLDLEDRRARADERGLRGWLQWATR